MAQTKWQHKTTWIVAHLKYMHFLSIQYSNRAKKNYTGRLKNIEHTFPHSMTIPFMNKCVIS